MNKGRKERLPIGYLSESNRKIIGYTSFRANIYLVECQKCNSVISGPSKTVHAPCKKCSYQKSNEVLQDLRAQIFYKYKYNAELKNLDFSISFDRFCDLIAKDCIYCGMGPLREWKSHRKKQNTVTYNGIDRKFNNLGYSDDNCVTCCSDCNYMKRAKSIDEFRDKIKIWSERLGKW